MFLLSKILYYFSLNFITEFSDTKHRNGIRGNRRLSLIFKVQNHSKWASGSTFIEMIDNIYEYVIL